MHFLEFYADAGLDILRSFQPMAGNDFEAAYREFGGKMTFATGIDTQRGEMMGPDEFREDILRFSETARSLRPEGGRFILAMTHMLQYSMPAVNVDTILRTVNDIRAGRRAYVAKRYRNRPVPR